jgi:hypothetical protein
VWARTSLKEAYFLPLQLEGAIVQLYVSVAGSPTPTAVLIRSISASGWIEVGPGGPPDVEPAVPITRELANIDASTPADQCIFHVRAQILVPSIHADGRFLEPVEFITAHLAGNEDIELLVGHQVFTP